MEALIEQITPAFMNSTMVDVETFIALHKEGKCTFVDIRMAFEREVWAFHFGLAIPLNELAKRRDELPKDTLIVLACPNGPRSIIGWSYLASEGYNVKFLKGGMEALTATLKGGAAKAFLAE